jgi:hypothetical protein
VATRYLSDETRPCHEDSGDGANYGYEHPLFCTDIKPEDRVQVRQAWMSQGTALMPLDED